MILIGLSVWIWALSSGIISSLAKYVKFFKLTLVFFGGAFFFGFVSVIPKKKKSKIKMDGELEVEEGAKVIFQAPKKKQSKVAKGTIRWLIALGSIITLISIGFGPIFAQLTKYPFIEHLPVAIGGFILGIGISLKLFRSK